MRSGPAIAVGRRADGGSPVEMPLSSVLRHGLVTGSSGCGKSGFVTQLLLTLLASPRPVRAVVLDPKGELAAELLRFLSALPRKALRGLTSDDVVTIAPFGRYGVPLNPLAPVPGLAPEAQARLVGSVVADLADGGLGPRMRVILERMALAFSAAGGSLAELRRALTDAAFRARVAARVPDPEMRRYLADELGDEPDASVAALAARLHDLLLLPNVRAMLCAEGCVSGATLLEAGVTIVDTGGAPQGMASVGRFLSALLYSRVTAAVFARPEANRDVPVVVVVDEAHEALKSAEDDVERMLTQARWKGVCCWLATQSVAQIPARLLPVVRTNAKWFAAFRPDPADLAHLDAFLPLTGRRPDPHRPDRLMSEADERKALLRELGRLPDREAFLVDTSSGAADVMRTLNLPFARARAASDALPPAEAEAWRRGRAGVPFADLVPASAVPTGGPDVEAGPAQAAAPRRRPAAAQSRRLVFP